MIQSSDENSGVPERAEDAARNLLSGVLHTNTGSGGDTPTPARLKRKPRGHRRSDVAEGDRYHPKIELAPPEERPDDAIAEGDQPSGIEYLIKAFFNALSNPDLNVRICNLENILTVSYAWSKTEIPNKPSFSSCVGEGKRMIKGSFIGTTRGLEEEVVRSGLGTTIQQQRYERELRKAVMAALADLQSNGYLRWSDFPADEGAPSMVSRGTDGRMFRAIGRA